MGKFEMKPESGNLFKNQRKEKETHPDYQGECLVGGVSYYMSAWVKTAESGRRWMSFSFKPKQQAQTPKPRPQQRQQPVEDDDLSDVPF